MKRMLAIFIATIMSSHAVFAAPAAARPFVDYNSYPGVAYIVNDKDSDETEAWNKLVAGDLLEFYLSSNKEYGEVIVSQLESLFKSLKQDVDSGVTTPTEAFKTFNQIQSIYTDVVGTLYMLNEKDIEVPYEELQDIFMTIGSNIAFYWLTDDEWDNLNYTYFKISDKEAKEWALKVIEAVQNKIDGTTSSGAAPKKIVDPEIGDQTDIVFKHYSVGPADIPNIDNPLIQMFIQNINENASEYIEELDDFFELDIDAEIAKIDSSLGKEVTLQFVDFLKDIKYAMDNEGMSDAEAAIYILSYQFNTMLGLVVYAADDNDPHISGTTDLTKYTESEWKTTVEALKQNNLAFWYLTRDEYQATFTDVQPNRESIRTWARKVLNLMKEKGSSSESTEVTSPTPVDPTPVIPVQPKPQISELTFGKYANGPLGTVRDNLLKDSRIAYALNLADTEIASTWSNIVNRYEQPDIKDLNEFSARITYQTASIVRQLDSIVNGDGMPVKEAYYHILAFTNFEDRLREMYNIVTNRMLISDKFSWNTYKTAFEQANYLYWICTDEDWQALVAKLDTTSQETVQNWVETVMAILDQKLNISVGSREKHDVQEVQVESLDIIPTEWYEMGMSDEVFERVKKEYNKNEDRALIDLVNYLLYSSQFDTSYFSIYDDEGLLDLYQQLRKANDSAPYISQQVWEHAAHNLEQNVLKDMGLRTAITLYYRDLLNNIFTEVEPLTTLQKALDEPHSYYEVTNNGGVDSSTIDTYNKALDRLRSNIKEYASKTSDEAALQLYLNLRNRLDSLITIVDVTYDTDEKVAEKIYSKVVINDDLLHEELNSLLSILPDDISWVRANIITKVQNKYHKTYNDNNSPKVKRVEVRNMILEIISELW